MFHPQNPCSALPVPEVPAGPEVECEAQPQVETRLQRAERLARWCMESIGSGHQDMIDEAEDIIARATGDAAAGKSKGGKAKSRR